MLAVVNFPMGMTIGLAMTFLGSTVLFGLKSAQAVRSLLQIGRRRRSGGCAGGDRILIEVAPVCSAILWMPLLGRCSVCVHHGDEDGLPVSTLIALRGEAGINEAVKKTVSSTVPRLLDDRLKRDARYTTLIG